MTIDRIAVLKLPSSAVVPYRDDARRIRRAVAALPYAVHRRWLGESFDYVARRVGERLIPVLRDAAPALVS